MKIVAGGGGHRGLAGDFAQGDALGLPEYSDSALARIRAARADGRARYVPDWGRWMFFSGTRWESDRILKSIRSARDVCLEAAAKILMDSGLTEKQRTALAAMTESTQKIYAVDKLSRSDITITADTDLWDRDPWLLNTPAGTIELRSGKLREHRAADYITKCTNVSPGGACPDWLKFLDRVSGGDGDLVQYVQRVFGYALTGSISEHALFLLFGTGANGKSTLLSVALHILRDYAATAAMETFVESYGERHPADLAMLMGARLVVAQETEEGRRWASSRIKALTGGDSISARFMRQDFFTYIPQFKLVLAGNHKPGLRNVDEAIRRRFNLIPFTETIPLEERDQALPDKLKAEGPGILAWMIEGCLTWQSRGLAPPEAVRSATDSYLADEDIFSSWIEECCERTQGAFARTSDLHQSYQRWASKAGERELGMKRFSQQLQEHGIERAQHPGDRSRGFRHIALKQGAIELR